MVAATFAVSVLVIVCTTTGAPPPIGTSLTQIWRLEATQRGYRGEPRPPESRMTRNMRPPREEIHRRGRPIVACALRSSASRWRPAIASASFHLNKIREVYPGTGGRARLAVRRAPDAGRRGELPPLRPDGLLQLERQQDRDVLAELTSPARPRGRSCSRPPLRSSESPETSRSAFSPASASARAAAPSAGRASTACPGATSTTRAARPCPPPTGSPAPAIPDGKALVRSISRGCPTLLEVSRRHRQELRRLCSRHASSTQHAHGPDRAGLPQHDHHRRPAPG